MSTPDKQQIRRNETKLLNESELCVLLGLAQPYFRWLTTQVAIRYIGLPSPTFTDRENRRYIVADVIADLKTAFGAATEPDEGGGIVVGPG